MTRIREIPLQAVATQPIETYEGAVLLACKLAGDTPVLHVLEDRLAPPIERTVHRVGVDEPVPEGVRHLGWTQEHAGARTWHWFIENVR